MKYHIPVLLNDSIDGLNLKEGGMYADLTFGGGGHSREILKRLNGGKLVVFDQDGDAFDNLPEDRRLLSVHSNFRYFSNFLRHHGVESLDGIIADLGISSWQIDQKHRGFSFRFESDLDMRMNADSEISAADILNEFKETDLKKLFQKNADIKNAGKIARIIVQRRDREKIKTTNDLVEILKPMFKPNQEHKFLSKIFQALRIEVNKELDALKEMLLQIPSVMKPGGRIVVLSYHSLEDKLVKNFFKTGNLEGEQIKDFYGNLISPFNMITRKPIMADDKEIEENPRARSVRLRIAEFKTDE